MLQSQNKTPKKPYLEVVKEEFASDLFRKFMNDDEGVFQFSFYDGKWCLTFHFPYGNLKAEDENLQEAVISLYSNYLNACKGKHSATDILQSLSEKQLVTL